jgi:hypothetical protein
MVVAFGLATAATVDSASAAPATSSSHAVSGPVVSGSHTPPGGHTMTAFDWWW